MGPELSLLSLSLSLLSQINQDYILLYYFLKFMLVLSYHLLLGLPSGLSAGKSNGKAVPMR